jgi:glycine oxidase
VPSPVSDPEQVLVVGAGVIGMMTALELQHRGYRVSLIDRAAAGRESTWAGGGILSPILPWNYPRPVWELSRRSLPLYRQLAPELAAATGIDPELTDSGALLLDPATGRAGVDWCAGAGLEAQWVDEALPAAGSLPALLLPWVGQIRNPRLGQALAARIVQNGVALHEHEPVTGWLRQGDRLAGVQTERGPHHADQVVLAAGAWSGELGGLPVAPVRGQMLLLRSRPGLLRRIVLDRGRYLIPRRDGRILVGSSVERVGFDKGISATVREQLLDFATGLLGDLEVQAHWSGLRPGSADEIPLIGRHPDWQNLWVNTGHYRNGLVMAPASAELLADLIQGQPTQVDAADYAVTPERIRAMPSAGDTRP